MAIDIASRGFGYAVLEGPDLLVDWALKETREQKQKKTLTLMNFLIERYQPDVMVVEDYTAKGSRRCQRIRELINGVQKLAAKRTIKTRSFSRRVVKKQFSQSVTANKHQIAMAVVQKFPELAPCLPPFRKPWMSEDPRMAIFNAAALALTYFKKTNQAT